MRGPLVLAIGLPISLGACGQGGDKLAEWHELQDMEFRAPKGLETRLQDGVLPGPDGMGGIPSGQELTLTLTIPPRRWFMQIVRTAYPLGLEGMKQAYLDNHIGTNLVGKTTPSGWELTSEVGRPASLHHVIYSDIAGGHFQCKWADENCDDPALAEAICRSMRAKAGT